MMSMQSLVNALAVSVALVYITQSGDIIPPLVNFEFIRSIPYGRSGLASLSDVLVMLLLTSLAARKSPVSILTLAGLDKPIARPAIWALLWFIPALAVCLFAARPASDVSPADFTYLTFISPLLEELAFRGLAVGVLMRLCGWSVWPACLLPAVFFGVVHAFRARILGRLPASLASPSRRAYVRLAVRALGLQSLARNPAAFRTERALQRF